MDGGNLRSSLFWTLDLLKKGTIRNHLREIKEIMESEKKNKKQLDNLLVHAKNTVPFYTTMNVQNLEDFPVIQKNDYKDKFNLFQSSKYVNEKNHQMSTSGSTGTPFTVNQDINKRKRTIADLIYFNEIEGQKLGDRYLYFKAWPKKKSKIESLKQNVIPVDVLRLDNKTLENIRIILKTDKSIKSSLAYASSYEVLGNYLLEKGDTPDMFNIKTMFSSSSLLSVDTRKKLEKIFGCSVIDRYSNQENGVLAQTDSTNEVFNINRASYYIELLKLNNNEPAEIGEIGRIVITDLYNFAMPMVRYDTGDLAISDDYDRTNLKTLRNIQGRRVDIIFDTQGNMLTPHTWGVHMRKFNLLKQWQFIQENEKRYVLKLNGAEGVYSKAVFDSTLRTILGNDAEIVIEYVDDIPQLSSGKFKNTICKYNN